MKFKNGQEIGLRKALYNSECDVCGSKLYWEAYYDADDGATWNAQCCKNFVLISSKVIFYSNNVDE